MLVSDFYNAYDSFECAQQKCLIHLIRDLNNDLINNPFDEDYKRFVKDFGRLLLSIVRSIDEYGLKKRYLIKHKKDSERFIEKLLISSSKSEIITYYKNRFRKYRNGLFTFLEYDGIPWNNNNAENAIKYFAAYRKVADGSFTETGIKNYVILLSVYQTCRYRRIDFLEFLKTRNVDIEDFIDL